MPPNRDRPAHQAVPVTFEGERFTHSGGGAFTARIQGDVYGRGYTATAVTLGEAEARELIRSAVAAYEKAFDRHF